MKGCNYCMMTIPCQCRVIGNNMQFDQKIIICNNKTRDITTLYSVNLAVIQQFFNDSQIWTVLADTSFNNSINIKIPPFKMHEHKMANIFADDFKYSLNLRKMANRPKKDQVIFSNLAESLVEGEVEMDDDDWPKTNDITTTTAPPSWSAVLTENIKWDHSFLLCFHSRQRFFCCTNILGFRLEIPEYVWKSPRAHLRNY